MKNRNCINNNTIVSDFEKTVFTKHDNIPNEIPEKLRPKALKLLDLLKRIADEWKKISGNELHFTCVYRCEELNKAVGGHPNSHHKTCEGADLVVLLQDQDKFMNMLKGKFIEELDFAQNYIYKIVKGKKIPRNFIHVNIDDNPRHLFKTEITKKKAILFGEKGRSIDLMKV